MYLTSATKLKRAPEYCVVFDCDPEVSYVSSWIATLRSQLYP